MRLILTLLLLFTAASCASVRKPPVILPVEVRQPAELYQCAAWPVASLLDAQTVIEQIAIVHAEAEPAHADCACRLYARGAVLQAQGQLIGELGSAPYGCNLTLPDSQNTH